MYEKRIPIAREGWPFIVGALALAGLGFYLLGLWGGVLPGIFFLFCVWFFRDPRRFPPVDENGTYESVISPADGRIVSIQEVEEDRLLKRRAKRVCIFMSPFNVHVNRAPLSGKVLDIAYNPGKFMNAAREKASLDNEQNAVLLQSAQGTPLLFVQIAGFIARRIVCYLKPGDQLKTGERVGLIRFGSRVDVYLPLNAQVRVGMKQRVVAGETPLAHIPLQKKGE